MSKPATASRDALRGLIAFVLLFVAVFIAGALWIGEAKVIAAIVLMLGVGVGGLIWGNRP